MLMLIMKPILGENVINWRLEVKSCLRCILSSVASSVICISKSSGDDNNNTVKCSRHERAILAVKQS